MPPSWSETAASLLVREAEEKGRGEAREERHCIEREEERKGESPGVLRCCGGAFGGRSPLSTREAAAAAHCCRPEKPAATARLGGGGRWACMALGGTWTDFQRLIAEPLQVRLSPQLDSQGDEWCSDAKHSTTNWAESSACRKGFSSTVEPLHSLSSYNANFGCHQRAPLNQLSPLSHGIDRHSSKVKLAAIRGGCRSRVQDCYHILTATATVHRMPTTTILAVAFNSTLPGTSPVRASDQEVT
ncbi:hypothetical protein HPB52_008014 [Rhipicephalus sanguineus]|uniref:Uncharacterized protein n=1 Tax=Rhipicephalus sanguineus TaxID=34632 RepID=A0A9D4PQB1_RHISA|nr:hypothetical protein HPB52_008014 [Rhipicephalus sanguineus]